MSSLGKDVIILNSFEYIDEVSKLFSLHAKAYFNNHKNNLNELIGKEVTVVVKNDEIISKTPRYIHGIVSQAILDGNRVAPHQDGGNYKNISLIT